MHLSEIKLYLAHGFRSPISKTTAAFFLAVPFMGEVIYLMARWRQVGTQESPVLL